MSDKIQLLNLVRVYLFDTNTFIDMHHCQTDTFFDLKKKIYNQLQNDEILNQKMKLKFQIDGYMLKHSKRENHKKSHSENSTPQSYDERDLILQVNCKSLSFVEKKDYIKPFSLERFGNIPSIEETDSKQIIIKIYLKFAGENNYILLQEDPNKTLKDILKNLYIRRLINFNSCFSYYFLEHGQEDSMSVDNEITLATELRDLPYNELDVNLYII
jgi:hypothetical protein